MRRTDYSHARAEVDPGFEDITPVDVSTLGGSESGWTTLESGVAFQVLRESQAGRGGGSSPELCIEINPPGSVCSRTFQKRSAILPVALCLPPSTITLHPSTANAFLQPLQSLDR